MTSKKIEDFFNLPSGEEISNDNEDDTTELTEENLLKEAEEIFTDLTMLERINIALPAVSDLDQHDRDMDDIANKAVKSFEDLISLGGNVPDVHAGKIYEVASTMLKTALDAKNAKAEKKLRIIELQLKKAKLDQFDDIDSGNGPTRSGEFDRNQIMKYIVDSVPKTDN